MHVIMMKDSSNATLDAKEAVVKQGFARLNDQELEAKSSKELIENENENEISGVMITTTSSLDYAAARACISREKYVASRQEFLRGYKLKKKENVGRKTKKWFKDNKPQNPLRFIVLLCVKLDVHH
ncbi:hypothetical protein TIFTF001_002537 [Ficus carica]|uniref:Uncharacterized protein n=1 Tax=Ficus carica TaxID=3494 RepID=A0AA87ZBE8_FICCA|nr:hypothetical protein TIFTF001_002537 [Ficus carica]